MLELTPPSHAFPRKLVATLLVEKFTSPTAENAICRRNQNYKKMERKELVTHRTVLIIIRAMAHTLSYIEMLLVQTLHFPFAVDEGDDDNDEDDDGGGGGGGKDGNGEGEWGKKIAY